MNSEFYEFITFRNLNYYIIIPCTIKTINIKLIKTFNIKLIKTFNIKLITTFNTRMPKEVILTAF